MPLALPERKTRQVPRGCMKALVFRGPGNFCLDEKAIPHTGPGEAVIEVRLTSICGTDIHIVKGECQVPFGLTLGHEAVGVIHELGAGVTGYEVGQRVMVAAVTPCGQCEPCLSGHTSQCTTALGGWRMGRTIDGAQAQYVLIPYAQANLAVIPDGLSDEDVLPLVDVASAGFSASENGRVRLGDPVAVFGQGPLGLCATLGAKLMGASEVFAVDTDAGRLKMSERFGATHTVPGGEDPVQAIWERTGGRGVDVAIEALGAQATFESALRVLKAGGVLSSVGQYSGHLRIPLEPFGAGLADQTIVTTLCPGGKERMHRLMRLVEARRIDLAPLLTHVFTLDDIGKAYELFASHGDHVLKVAVRVS